MVRLHGIGTRKLSGWGRWVRCTTESQRQIPLLGERTHRRASPPPTPSAQFAKLPRRRRTRGRGTTRRDASLKHIGIFVRTLKPVGTQRAFGAGRSEHALARSRTGSRPAWTSAAVRRTSMSGSTPRRSVESPLARTKKAEETPAMSRELGSSNVYTSPKELARPPVSSPMSVARWKSRAVPCPPARRAQSWIDGCARTNRMGASLPLQPTSSACHAPPPQRATAQNRHPPPPSRGHRRGQRSPGRRARSGCVPLRRARRVGAAAQRCAFGPARDGAGAITQAGDGAVGRGAQPFRVHRFEQVVQRLHLEGADGVLVVRRHEDDERPAPVIARSTSKPSSPGI